MEVGAVEEDCRQGIQAEVPPHDLLLLRIALLQLGLGVRQLPMEEYVKVIQSGALFDVVHDGLGVRDAVVVVRLVSFMQRLTLPRA